MPWLLSCSRANIRAARALLSVSLRPAHEVIRTQPPCARDVAAESEAADRRAAFSEQN